MKYINLFVCLLLWTEMVFATTTFNNNITVTNKATIGQSATVAGQFVKGTSFISGDFENSTLGWTVAHSALTSLIPTSTTTAGTALSVGTGLTAATNLALTATSTNPLAGSYSGLLTASATSTAGDLLISPAISIPNSAKAKMITIGFSYSASSAINLSGTASNSFAVYVYDIDNATWIQPAGTYGMIDGSTYAQVKNITFQTSSNGTKYQLAIVNINSIAAYTLKIDEIYFGTQPYSSGAAMSDWKTGSCTSSWTTNATTTCKYRRIGDSAEIKYYLALTGATNTAQLSFSTPSGLVIDTGKIDGHIVVKGNAYTLSYYPILTGYMNSSTSIAINYHIVSGSVTSEANLTNTAPNATASGYFVNVTAIVPIVGWSSNTVQSADSDGRVISAKAYQSTPTAYSAGGTISFGTVAFDDLSGMNTTYYKVPSSGKYAVTFSGYTSGVVTNFIINTSNGVDIVFTTSTNANTGTLYYNLKAGDSIWITVFAACTVNAAILMIEKLSGPAVVQASESVNARYTNSAGTTIGVADTVIPFATKVFDSHSAYNTSTGVYTCPVSGKYRISSRITTASANWGAGTYLNLYLYKNGSFNSLLSLTYGTGATLLWSGGGTDIVDCKQSETIAIYANAYAQVNLFADSTRNYLTIERIGN